MFKNWFSLKTSKIHYTVRFQLFKDFISSKCSEKCALQFTQPTLFGYTSPSTSKLAKTSNFKFKITSTSKINYTVNFWRYGKFLIVNGSLEATLSENISLITYVRKLHLPDQLLSLTQKSRNFICLFFGFLWGFCFLYVCFVVYFFFLCFLLFFWFVFSLLLGLSLFEGSCKRGLTRFWRVYCSTWKGGTSSFPRGVRGPSTSWQGWESGP